MGANRERELDREAMGGRGCEGGWEGGMCAGEGVSADNVRGRWGGDLNGLPDGLRLVTGFSVGLSTPDAGWGWWTVIPSSGT